MIPVDQTRFGEGDEGDGNCYPACLASLLELPLAAVPDMMGVPDWLEAYNGWARVAFGMAFVRTGSVTAGSVIIRTGAYYIAGGPCERGGRHACVYQGDQLAHDPHPSRAGLLSVDTWTVLVPLDPSKPRRLREAMIEAIPHVPYRVARDLRDALGIGRRLDTPSMGQADTGILGQGRLMEPLGLDDLEGG